jgi:hypothetical protein
MPKPDPVTELFDGLIGYGGPNEEHTCACCGVKYHVVGGKYDPPYDRFCGSACLGRAGGSSISGV